MDFKSKIATSFLWYWLCKKKKTSRKTTYIIILARVCHLKWNEKSSVVADRHLPEIITIIIFTKIFFCLKHLMMLVTSPKMGYSAYLVKHNLFVAMEWIISSNHSSLFCVVRKNWKMAPAIILRRWMFTFMMAQFLDREVAIQHGSFCRTAN